MVDFYLKYIPTNNACSKSKKCMQCKLSSVMLQCNRTKYVELGRLCRVKSFYWKSLINVFSHNVIWWLNIKCLLQYKIQFIPYATLHSKLEVSIGQCRIDFKEGFDIKGPDLLRTPSHYSAWSRDHLTAGYSIPTSTTRLSKIRGKRTAADIQCNKYANEVRYIYQDSRTTKPNISQSKRGFPFEEYKKTRYMAMLNHAEFKL